MEPSTVRTNQDRVMIYVGVALILFFFCAGYISCARSDKQPTQNKIRGPVKNPNRSGSLPNNSKGFGNLTARLACERLCVPRLPSHSILTSCSSYGESLCAPALLSSSSLPQQGLPPCFNKNLSDGLTGFSMPFPDKIKKQQALLYRISPWTGSSMPIIFPGSAV